MGSWNETCGISQLPIRPGEKVRVLFIVGRPPYSDNNRTGGIYYVDDIYYPYALPVRGEYGDYGYIENVVEDWNTEHIINLLKRDMVEKELGENKYHDPPTKKDNLTIENVVEWIGENRVDLEYFRRHYDYDFESRPSKETLVKEERVIYYLGHVFILENIYQTCISRGILEWGEYNDMRVKQTKEGEEFVKDMIDRYNECKKIPDYQFTNTDRYLFPSGGDFGHNFKTPPFVPGGLEAYPTYIWNKVLKEDFTDTDRDIFIKEFLDFSSVSQRMYMMRKYWHPQSGLGSQSESWEDYKLLSQTIIKHCDEKLEEKRKW